MTHWINYPIIVLLTAALFGLLLSESRKITSIFMGIVYVLAFIVIVQSWTIGLSIVKLITGLMSIVILNISSMEQNQTFEAQRTTGKIFRAATFSLVLILFIFTYSGISEIFTIDLEVLISALFVFGCGLIQLGISQNVYRVILGLLTLLLGFEIIYCTVEKALLINGFLAVINLLIALIGSYLMINSVREEVK